MIKTTALAAAGLAAAGVLALPTPASATTVGDCLAAHPGAVAFDNVTPGDDVVCVDDMLTPSGGDDTYFWVPTSEMETKLIVPRPQGVPLPSDPGYDTLTLADWAGPFQENWVPATTGDDVWILDKSLYGDLLHTPDMESIRFTPFNDKLGVSARPSMPTTCNTTTFGDFDYYFGAGDDTVRCWTGRLNTGAGADDVIDGGWGSTVTTGDGADEVIANAGTDTLVLGGGADIARVRNGGVDTVKAGAGDDVAYASKNDIVTSARKVTS